ncbi:MAG: beta-N-acetylhexosaminidase [Clostridia bacterium]|nr:beta-N-acetylhexosaminidase [Clostridia bacterium]
MKFNLIHLPDELKGPLKEIEGRLSFSMGEEGRAVKVQKGEKLSIDASGEEILLTYHKKVEFFRLLTLLPSHLEGVYEETPAHEDLCLMSDCSRNAVFNMKGAKKMIRALALMGFTSFMLYTEDTYEIPEYPFFGYQRGRFSQAELKEIDDYAASFGIEVIPCIQMLAHLNGALRWPAFGDVTDVGDILLVGEEKTYQLLDAMLRSLRKVFRTKKIHIGMDEAHLLGSGKYLDKNGYRPRSEILLEHLEKCCKMCAAYDFEPMMWSDMFFRIQFDGQYYVEEGEIEQKVMDLVPENLSLVYWDYYSENEKIFRHMVHCHKQFKNPMIFAGGAWKWHGMSPCNFFSLKVNDIHLKVSREERVPMVIATAWGDNGAEASQFSILPTLQQYAEYCYAKGEDRSWVAKRFEETFQIPFDTFLLLDSPALLSDNKELSRRKINSKHLLYNAPLAGWLDWCIKPFYATEYAEKAKALHEIPKNEYSYLFESAAKLCDVLALKATLSLDIRAAYEKKDKKALKELAEIRIPATIKALENYLPFARAEWYMDNKTYGFDVIEIRIGGLKEQLSSTALMLHSFLKGEIEKIDQLEEPLLEGPNPKNNWALLVTGVVN